MYDVIIMGGGPAGIAAAIHCKRYKLKSLLIYKNLGGMVSYAHNIENYPGFKSISGVELVNKFEEQLKYLKVEMKTAEIINIEKKGNFILTDKENKKYEAKNVIFALGTEKKQLNAKGEEKFLGKGVSYCYICDAAIYKGKTVAVVGGSDSAAKAALLLSEYAKKVYIIYRKEMPRCNPHYLDEIQKKGIEILSNTEIKEIKGKKFVESVLLNNKELKLDGVFIEIGSVPSVFLAKKLGVKLNEDNYIIVNSIQETNVEGLYAAGDITNHPLKQIVTAVAQGAAAANSIFKKLASNLGFNK